jgi:hypothetical protein
MKSIKAMREMVAHFAVGMTRLLVRLRTLIGVSCLDEAEVSKIADRL